MTSRIQSCRSVCLRLSHLLAAAILCVVVSAATYADTSESRTLDPLSHEELQAAVDLNQPILGLRDSQPGKQQRPSEPGTNRAVLHQELLLVERRQQEKGQSKNRLADVYTYDYAANELIHVIVDVGRGTVVHSEFLTGVQLPLTPKEVEHAMQIVYEDSEQRDLINSEFTRVTGRPLNAISDLRYKAFVFHADTMTEGVSEATQNCGVHRCAQLLLYSADNIVIDVSPVVDLSEGVVTQSVIMSDPKHSSSGGGISR